MDEFDFELEQLLGKEDKRGRGNGGRPRASIVLEYVRDMTPEDLEELAGPREVRLPAVKRLRYTHHRLARMVALGQKGVDISQLAGFSQSRLSILSNDPAFQELVEFYKTQVDEIFADAAEEIADMGMDYMRELYNRFEQDPESFSKKELYEFGSGHLNRTILPDKSKGTPQGGSSTPAVKNININLVQPKETSPPAEIIDDAEYKDVDGE